MSEILRPIAFDKLIKWMLTEYQNDGAVFGVRKDKFYKRSGNGHVRLFGTELSSPVGAAAGPNTQLAQNILTAYLSGLKVIELKTVQIMDGEALRKCIERPCIDAEKEGYNCEWSTELTVEQAFDEYVKGWFLVHAAANEFELSDKRDFLFNMSVGYDFEGITSPKIDSYIENLKDAANTEIFKSCKQYLTEHIADFQHLTLEDIDGIGADVSTSITLSTLHGCPPEEIEKIAGYFIDEKELHTYVKLNPTLLGFDQTRSTLDKMGYTDVDFDTTHFEQDLKYADAVPMIERLMKRAKKQDVAFGVKITNTFPVKSNGRLPSEYMYMSGKALYPLSIQVAAMLAEEFKGDLPISYSGGADAFNIADIFKTGIKPITVATTILKPGGYARADQLSRACETIKDQAKVDFRDLKTLAEEAVNNPHYAFDDTVKANKKSDQLLPLTDCYMAPCRETGCPINQQIPVYLAYAESGDYERAFEVIVNDNVLPSITGEICNHNCQTKCNRVDYEGPLNIRAIKKETAEKAQDAYIASLSASALKTDRKVCVIGAGPAGMACAAYLRRNGVKAVVFEKESVPMGVVGHVVPDFRIDKHVIERDMRLAHAYGVELELDTPVEIDIETLKKTYEYIVIATGAHGAGFNPLKEGKENAVDALTFLKAYKRGKGSIKTGARVGVIGGGDVAMDCARAAKRTGADVSIIYRRTKAFMPAEPEELKLALEDGVQIKELLSPVKYDGKTLTVEVMQLGAFGADGRRTVSGTGEMKELPVDYLINATGSAVDQTPYEKNGIKLDKKQNPVLSGGFETNLENVYVAGDCRKGPETIVRAMADGKVIAKDILKKLNLPHDFIDFKAVTDLKIAADRKGILKEPVLSAEDGMRCLSCGQVCELCVDVCPNRANKAVKTANGNMQIVHIDGMCNECGSCAVFCPYDGGPYKDKLTLFWEREDFFNSTNQGFLMEKDGSFLIRTGEDIFPCVLGDARLSDDRWEIIKSVLADYDYLF